MSIAPREYLKRPYMRVLLLNESGEWSSEILEFRGCYSFGDSPNEAIANLDSVAEAWIESELGRGRDIPRPGVIEIRLKKWLEFSHFFQKGISDGEKA